MNKIWIYNLGEWSEYTHEQLELKPWKEGETIEKFLKENRFSDEPRFSLGEEFTFMAQFYESLDYSRKWFVSLIIHNICDEIIIHNTPSLLMFLNEYKEFYSNPKHMTNFLPTEDGDYINKNSIQSLRVNYKKDFYELYAVDRSGTKKDILFQGSRSSLDQYEKDYL